MALSLIHSETEEDTLIRKGIEAAAIKHQLALEGFKAALLVKDDPVCGPVALREALFDSAEGAQAGAEALVTMLKRDNPGRA